MPDTPARPGRPRDRRIDPLVREATLALLVDGGYAALRIDDVARRAGVAKTTIYRRWASLAELVLDTVEDALGPRVVPETGDVEADLEAVVRAVHQSLVANPVGWSLPALGLDLSRDPVLGRDYRRRIIEPPRDQAIRLVRKGQELGRFDAAVAAETLVDAVAGIWAFRQLVGMPPPPVEDVVAVLRASLRTGPPRGRRRSPR